uniref:Uncharacterized protein n=1 Tax=Anguilla anguilla TaxID=7936 RepID=A0A0E9UFL6_ANGAN
MVGLLIFISHLCALFTRNWHDFFLHFRVTYCDIRFPECEVAF